MSSDLAYWEQRLAGHFRDLASRRSELAGNRAVFALEHGLDAREIKEVSDAVRAHIVQAEPSNNHALSWLVYAAEIGYDYSGDEYWQTFERETPGWTINGNRNWIRNRYRLFQREYAGAVPTGRWAEWFTIICWPITHAILPRDLQRQLARTLYELRHSFSVELFESPPRLGEFIASRSWSGTSRFQNFAQETHLVGQIAAALLLQEQLGTGTLIHPKTLHRIGTDLEHERRAREWLRGARHYAQKRATIRGLSLGRGAASALVHRPDEARAEVAALGIEPRLVLLPKSSDASCWEVSLEIPDLSHLLFRFPKTQDVLTGSRCVVAGASGRPLARGRCLHGTQRVKLSRWPRDDDVLLQFEKTDEQLEYLLRTECLLRPGPRWLFRIATDGLAYESRSLRVRPGERYILVTTAGPCVPSEHVRPIELECERVDAVLLDLPEALSGDWEETLRRLDLGQAKTVEVWPAGLGAVVWDGEGHGEWLASELPCLAIQTDHSIAALLVSLGTTPDLSLEVTSVTPGEPIFVQLPQLPVGIHSVRVATRSSTSGETESLGDLDVVIRIREARPWAAGVARSGPLVVQVDPSTPTLEQLWEGQADIGVCGPTGRVIKCVVSFFEGTDQHPLLTMKLPPLSLPLEPTQWKEHFDKHFRRLKKAEDTYDSARLCRLDFVADELGAFTIECEREFVPLRWAIRQRDANFVARLVDDSGSMDPPDVSFFAFERPIVAVSPPSSVEAEFPINPPGGLFMARRDGLTTAVIGVPRTFRNLADLRAVPEIEDGTRSVEAVLDALECARMWHLARSSGNILSLDNRRKVLQAISHHVLSLLGGEQWARAEDSALRGSDADLSALKLAVSNRRDQGGIAAALALEVAELAAVELEARVARLADLVVSFRVLGHGTSHHEYDTPIWLAELSLRVASSPGHAVIWAEPHLRLGIRRLLEDMPVLVRAARFLVIATDRHLQSRAAPGEMFAGWGWG